MTGVPGCVGETPGQQARRKGLPKPSTLTILVLNPPRLRPIRLATLFGGAPGTTGLGQPEDAWHTVPQFLASESESIFHDGQRASDRWRPNSPIKCGNVTNMTLRQVLARSRLDADDLVPVG